MLFLLNRKHKREKDKEHVFARKREQGRLMNQRNKVSYIPIYTVSSEIHPNVWLTA